MNSRGRVVIPMLRILEVPGSNLGPETGYNEVSSWFFLSPSRRMLGQYLKIRPQSLLPNPFQFIIHHPSIRRYIVLVTEKAS
jgi:hypothetical protein